MIFSGTVNCFKVGRGGGVKDAREVHVLEKVGSSPTRHSSFSRNNTGWGLCGGVLLCTTFVYITQQLHVVGRCRAALRPYRKGVSGGCFMGRGLQSQTSLLKEMVLPIYRK
jgi:hypothetical protein